MLQNQSKLYYRTKGWKPSVCCTTTMQESRYAPGPLRVVPEAFVFVTKPILFSRQAFGPKLRKATLDQWNNVCRSVYTHRKHDLCRCALSATNPLRLIKDLEAKMENGKKGYLRKQTKRNLYISTNHLSYWSFRRSPTRDYGFWATTE